MNSAEIKKIIWFVNFIFFCGLTLVGYFLWNLAYNLVPTVAALRYIEPDLQQVYKKRDMVLLSDLMDVFGEAKKPLPELEAGALVAVREPIAKVSQKPDVYSIDSVLELHHILGRLAMVYVKKDKQLHTVIVGEEIKTLSGESLGVLKEIGEDFVLLLLKGQVETLYMDPESKKKELGQSLEASVENGGSGASKVMPGLEVVKDIDRIILRKGEARATHRLKEGGLSAGAILETASIIDSMTARPSDDSAAVGSEVESVNKQAGTFYGQAFEFAESVDKDGVTLKMIPRGMALQLQKRENTQKLLNANHYEMVYRKDGILIQKISDGEIEKLFGVIGIQQGDLLVRANGQHLGGKSEDILLDLVSQISDSSAYLDLEYKHKGQDRRVRVAVGEFQNKNDR